MTLADLSPRIRALLVCPDCRSALVSSAATVSCSTCRFQRIQPEEFVDLRATAVRLASDWSDRQATMEHWYHELASTPGAVGDCYRHDYTDLAPLLATLSGVVVDIGGGSGIARSYLPATADYLLIEPSPFWLGYPATAAEPALGSDGGPLPFVRAFGEHLPLPSGAADVALALWSLNHASAPALAVEEAHRVLRDDGRFVVVLEDMRPTAADVSVRPDLTRWLDTPPGADHVPFSEADFMTWIEGRFTVSFRGWIRHYLMFDLCRVRSVAEAAHSR